MIIKIHKKLFFHFTSISLFFLFSIYITYPLIFNLGNRAVGQGDELVISWIMNWVIHAIVQGNIYTFFDANLYYPYLHSLAYSDLFITSSLLAIIPLWIVQEPIVVVNFTLITSLTLVGFSLYLLSYYLTKDFLASLFAGILVIFSPAVLDKATHLQILSIYWVPLAILFFLKFLNLQRTKYLLVSLIFFLCQVYNSFLPGYFILFSYLIILIYYWLWNKEKAKALFIKKNILALLITFILVIPIAVPYFQVAREFNYVRDIRDAIHFALQPEDLFYPSAYTRLQQYLLDLPFNQISQNNEFKPGYVGFIFTVLIVLSIFYTFKYYIKERNVSIFLTIALTGLIISLGPVLHLGRQTIHDPFPIPLPYALFYYLLPGFQGFRNSARWEMLFILAIVIVVAMAIHSLLKKYSLKTQTVIYLLLIIVCIAEFNFPMKFEKIPAKSEFPKVDYWLTTTPKDIQIVHLPIYNWNMWPYTQNELWREYYSTLHFRKMVNGYSGFSPPPWQALVHRLHDTVPKKESITLLKNLQVNYIVVNKKDYDNLFKDNQARYAGNAIINAFKNNPSLRFVRQLDNQYIFEVIYE